MLVIPSLGDVPYPLGRLVPTFLIHSEESNSQSGGSEHGNLELHRDWRLHPSLFILFSSQLNVTTKKCLVISLELFDPPNDSPIFWFVLGSSNSCICLNIGHCLRTRNLQRNIG